MNGVSAAKLYDSLWLLKQSRFGDDDEFPTLPEVRVALDVATAAPEDRAEGLDRLQALIAAVEDACPVCHGDGWTVDADPTDETGQTPMQVPCWDAEHAVILNDPNGVGALAARLTPDRTPTEEER